MFPVESVLLAYQWLNLSTHSLIAVELNSISGRLSWSYIKVTECVEASNPLELSTATTTRSISGGIGSKRQLNIWISGQLNLSCIQVAQWKKELVSDRQQLLLLPLWISERVWNCKCERSRLIANVHQLLQSNFIRPFFWISGCLCLCCTAVNQSTATTAIMLQDPVDADDLFDSPEKPLDLKTCSVFMLPAVDTTNLFKGWRCRHCGGSWAKRC